MFTFLFFYSTHFYESFENDKTKSIEIVVARYNEDLRWLQNEPFNNYNYIVYNKGDNNAYYKSKKCKGEFQLKNVGRESHSYLTYIINNYDKLKDITVFFPGSLDMESKIERGEKIIKLIEDNNSAVFLSTNQENVKKDLYSFQLDNYQSTYANNRSLTANEKLTSANVRPYGKWFESKFGDLRIKNIAWGGIFSVSKEDILRKPESYYESLLNDLNEGSNLEVGHYFERSWEAVFHPMSNTIII